ncbi:hypothetical protein GCM10009551_015290 [Nocardiopsis tropica]
MSYVLPDGLWDIVQPLLPPGKTSLSPHVSQVDGFYVDPHLGITQGGDLNCRCPPLNTDGVSRNDAAPKGRAHPSSPAVRGGPPHTFPGRCAGTRAAYTPPNPVQGSRKERARRRWKGAAMLANRR